MQLNSFLFPAPQVSYTPQDLDGEMVYIPHYFKFNEKFRKELSEAATKSNGFERNISESEQTMQAAGAAQ